jgi:hypothetical protein
MDMNTILIIKGKKTTMEEFKTRFGIETDAKAIQMAQILVKKGNAVVHIEKSEEQDLLDKLEADALLASIVNQLDTEEYSAEQAKREQAKADTDLVSIKLAFTSSAEAAQAETWINSLGIEDTEITMKKGAISLIVRDITPQEYTKIATRYQMDKAIDSTVKVASKALVGTTNAINYTATKVVAPTAKIAGEATMNLGKGLVHASMKVGAGLVNSGSKAITDTKVALATDTEMIRAKKELIDAKDSAISFFKRKLNKNRKKSGIETL